MQVIFFKTYFSSGNQRAKREPNFSTRHNLLLLHYFYPLKISIKKFLTPFSSVQIPHQWHKKYQREPFANVRIKFLECKIQEELPRT